MALTEHVYIRCLNGFFSQSLSPRVLTHGLLVDKPHSPEARDLISMPSSPSRATQPPWTCRPSGRGAFYGNPHVPKDSGVAESSSSQRQENATQNKGSKTEGLPRNVPHARNGSSKLRCKAWVFGPALSLLGLLEALLLKGDGEDK